MCFFIAFKGHLQRCPFCFAFIWFRVEVAASPPFFRSGVKDYVRLSVSLKRHPDRSGGILLAER